MATFEFPKIYELGPVFYEILTAGKARSTKEDL
jgi:hypothetical protein